MRNVKIKLILFSLAFIIFTESVNAQGNKPANYEYFMGQRVAFSLMPGSSVLVGSIYEINGDKITFSIEETLLGDKPEKDTIELNYKEPVSETGRPSLQDSPWRFVEVKQGNKLIVFLKKDRNREPSFITSDAKLFPSIRKSVSHYISYRQKPEILLKISDLIKSEDDPTFIGYLVKFISGGKTLTHSDNTALVLSQLLESDKISDANTYDIIHSLTMFICGDKVFPITPDTRDIALKNVIKVAGSKKILAAEAVNILGRVANQCKLDLRDYLNSQNKIQIRENLKNLSFTWLTSEDRESLELLLTRQ